MLDLESLLKKRLRNSKKIVLLGIGSLLRADDAAGMLVAERLKNFKTKRTNFRVLFGETAPENLTGEIKRLKPKDVIIVDAADTGKLAGAVTVFQPQELKGVTFSTHQLPLSILAKYLVESLHCRVIILGIQPKTLKFGLPCSKEVKQAVESVTDSIKKAISGRKVRII